jgi:PAS domain S-box-containing protein
MTPERERLSRLPEACMLGVSLVIVFAMGTLSYQSGVAAHAAEQQRELTRETLKLEAALLSNLKDGETGQRGFLLTGRERYLQPYQEAVAIIPLLMEKLKSATASQPPQNALVRRMDPLILAKLAELKATIDLRHTNRAEEALAIVDTGRGKAYMDAIRAIGGEIEDRALAQLRVVETDARQAALNLRRVSTGGAVLLGAFLMFATVTIFRGMTRREALFRQAYAGEKLMTTTLSSIADGVIATDANGRVTFINPVAQNLTGWSEAEAIGTGVSQLFVIVNESTRLTLPNPIDKALAFGTPVALANHTNLISRSGEERPIDDSAAPVRDVDGNLVGAVLVFRDISVRRRAEQQLRNSNEELQRFVDAAAHDLRSPLNSVHGMAELLAARYAGEVGPKGDELIRYISTGTERMKRLLDDLLTFARATHFDETNAPAVSLHHALESALENLKAEVERTGAVVTHEPLPNVLMHEAHALQLFQNLIGNALKYHGEQPPRIHVSARQKNGEWMIRISDNGIGIEPEYMDQIFKPFKRLHGDDYPGSGIGLATCQRIVRGYGGRIWVESSPGRGSTFSFGLPARHEVTVECSMTS